MFAFNNLTKPRHVKSGIAEYALVAPYSWITKVKGVTDDGVEITEKHIFKPGKGFLRFNLAPQKNRFSTSTIGDPGTQNMEQTLEMFLPGSYKELHETVRHLLNQPLLILARDSSCCVANMYYQLGDECIGAQGKFDFSTDYSGGGQKGYSVTVKYYQQYVQLYDGFLDLYPDDSDDILNGVFLANLGLETINSSNILAAYSTGYTDDWENVYNAVKSYADLEILYIAYAAKSGTKAENYVAEIDFTTIDTFKADLVNWLKTKDSSNTLTLTSNKLVLSNGGYIGLAVPQSFLDTGDGSLLIDKDQSFILTK